MFAASDVTDVDADLAISANELSAFNFKPTIRGTFNLSSNEVVK